MNFDFPSRLEEFATIKDVAHLQATL